MANDPGEPYVTGTCRTQTKSMALSVEMLDEGADAKLEIMMLCKNLTAASMRATRALELYARDILNRREGFHKDLDWCLLINQMFQMTNSVAHPNKIQPGWERFCLLWEENGGEANDLDMQYLTQAITFESQAYITTIMKNYCHIRPSAHFYQK